MSSLNDNSGNEEIEALLQKLAEHIHIDGEKLRFSSDVVFDRGVQVLGETVKLQERRETEASSLVVLGSEDEHVPYGGISIQTPQGPRRMVWIAEEDAWYVHQGDEWHPIVRQPFLFTQTHNFWIANDVVETTGSSKEILPEFVSCLDHEQKWISGSQARVSNGAASVAINKNNRPTGHEVQATPEAPKSEFIIDLEDGDQIGIDVLKSQNARNLSVSLTVTTKIASPPKP